MSKYSVLHDMNGDSEINRNQEPIYISTRLNTFNVEFSFFNNGILLRLKRVYLKYYAYKTNNNVVKDVGAN